MGLQNMWRKAVSKEAIQEFTNKWLTERDANLKLRQEPVDLNLRLDALAKQIQELKASSTAPSLGPLDSKKQVFGRGSGKDCRAHVQRLNEDKRRKETLVLNRRINVQCAENAIHTGANIPVVKNSKWNKYLSDEEDDNSDDSIPMSPSELGIGGASAVNKEQSIQNYSASAPVNIYGGNFGVPPENWNEQITHLSETPFNENEDTHSHVSETSTYFSAGNNTFDDYKSGGINRVCELQRNSSPLCFALLPETSTTELLDCDSQQEILSDISSDSFTSNVREAVLGKQLPTTHVRDIIPTRDFIPTKSEINKNEEEKTSVQLQSHIHGSSVTDLGTKTINLKNNVKQIFSKKYNEDELDEILKF